MNAQQQCSSPREEFGPLQTNSTIYNFLVDYDQAKSVVVYGNGNLLACQNLQPPFPNFPRYPHP